MTEFNSLISCLLLSFQLIINFISIFTWMAFNKFEIQIYRIHSGRPAVIPVTSKRVNNFHYHSLTLLILTDYFNRTPATVPVTS